MFSVCTFIFPLLGACQGCRWCMPCGCGVWASIELLVCVLCASCSHLEPSFDLLEITVRIPLASPGLRSHGLLKSLGRVSFSGWAKQSPRAKQLDGQVPETHEVHDLTDLKEAPSAIALAHNSPFLPTSPSLLSTYQLRTMAKWCCHNNQVASRSKYSGTCTAHVPNTPLKEAAVPLY